MYIVSIVSFKQAFSYFSDLRLRNDGNRGIFVATCLSNDPVKKIV